MTTKDSNYFAGKTILMTGGTGSFGKKFTEIIQKKCPPKKLIIFSRDEMKQWEMAKTFSQDNIRYFVGDVRDVTRLRRALQNVDMVIHAAALKIVPVGEYDPFEVIKTNVIGAENVIEASIDCGVERVMALSTDKAVNPINLYGASKLCAEKMFLSANNYSPLGTKFSVVRYGNVIGSRGSVVPLFKSLAKTGTLPITDKRMTRFWITLEDGVNFVLTSLKQMYGGEIFVPKIPSMKITDLAKAVAPNAKIKEVGIRPGEKLHEILLSVDDARHTIELKDRYVTYPDVIQGKRLKIKGKNLAESFDGYRSDNNPDWITVKQLDKLIQI